MSGRIIYGDATPEAWAAAGARLMDSPPRDAGCTAGYGTSADQPTARYGGSLCVKVLRNPLALSCCVLGALNALTGLALILS